MKLGRVAFCIAALPALLGLCSLLAPTNAAEYTGAFEGGWLRTEGFRIIPSEWMDRLLASEDWLLEPRYEFHLTDEVALNNCEEFFDVRDDPELWYGATTRLQHGEYTPCQLAALLERADPPQRSFFPEKNLGEDVAARLNMLSFCSSLQPGYKPLKTLSVFEILRSEIRVGESSIEIEREDWYRGLDLLAGADVTGDGAEDLLALYVDDSYVGTYLIIGILVLVTDGPDAPIRALHGDELLLGYSGTCEDMWRRARGEIE